MRSLSWDAKPDGDGLAEFFAERFTKWVLDPAAALFFRRESGEPTHMVTFVLLSQAVRFLAGLCRMDLPAFLAKFSPRAEEWTSVASVFDKNWRLERFCIYGSGYESSPSETRLVLRTEESGTVIFTTAVLEEDLQVTCRAFLAWLRETKNEGVLAELRRQRR